MWNTHPLPLVARARNAHTLALFHSPPSLEEEYVVEAILRERLVGGGPGEGGRVEYLVKWEGSEPDPTHGALPHRAPSHEVHC